VAGLFEARHTNILAWRQARRMDETARQEFLAKKVINMADNVSVS